MTPFLLAAAFSCSQVIAMSERIVKHVHLNQTQKLELFHLLRKEVPNCPIYYDTLDKNKPIKLKK